MLLLLLRPQQGPLLLPLCLFFLVKVDISGVICPLLTNFGGPSAADLGEFGASVSDTPSGSTAAISPLAGLLSASG